jgi:hypothetical protein
MTQNHIAIVMLTFKDWASHAQLIKDIDTLPRHSPPTKKLRYEYH